MPTCPLQALNLHPKSNAVVGVDKVNLKRDDEMGIGIKRCYFARAHSIKLIIRTFRVMALNTEA